jgi:hypothetical protein
MTKESTKDLMFKSAMYYCEKMGYSVIPVGQDKKPLIPWQDYQTRKPSKKEITDWWLLKFPEASIGIVTGKISDLVVVDIDDPNITHEVLDSVEKTSNPPACTTPREGRHLYFSCPDEEIRNTVNFLNKVDIRAEGGYVVAPPSTNGNGKSYAWIKGKKITDNKPKEFPISLINIYKNNNNINNKINNNSIQYTNSIEGEILHDATGELQNATKHNISLRSLQNTTDTTNYYTSGRRDEDLFHVANCLVKGGAESSFIRSTIENLAMGCLPPFSLKEANEKLLSALNRQDRKAKNLTQEVEEFISAQDGYFDVASIAQNLQLNTKEEKKHLTVIMHRLKERNIIQPYGNKAGRYRIIVNDAEVMDYMKASVDEFPISLPYGLSDLCKIYPGNIIMVAGSKSSGKTAFMLNLVKENMKHLPVVYMNSEMGETELRIRLELFEDVPLKSWKFTPVARASNWEDLITQEKKIFIIDYLDITDDLWKIGSVLKSIHEKLKDGVAVIAIQRNTGSSLGRGGSFSIEKARLYLNLDYEVEEKCNIIKIQDCKAWRDRNPRGMQLRYKLYRGSSHIAIGGWND